MRSLYPETKTLKSKYILHSILEIEDNYSIDQNSKTYLKVIQRNHHVLKKYGFKFTGKSYYFKSPTLLKSMFY